MTKPDIWRLLLPKKGQLTVPFCAASEDGILEIILEAGAEDLENELIVSSSPRPQIGCMRSANY